MPNLNPDFTGFPTWLAWFGGYEASLTKPCSNNGAKVKVALVEGLMKAQAVKAKR